MFFCKVKDFETFHILEKLSSLILKNFTLYKILSINYLSYTFQILIKKYYIHYQKNPDYMKIFIYHYLLFLIKLF